MGILFDRGNLELQRRAAAMERDLGDYVIVHELLHFSVPNHGKLWKSLMRAHLGEYEQLEARAACFICGSAFRTPQKAKSI